ncbi:RNA polymerase sigma factor sigF, chloroplastic isoform X2 [Silene latifolia]|uniref:RNA polymerase sigma factor sigF, chloroplastic isoform X2 n=1 Tax=Silene latifolia TaxID=37657 RepID=UPI003D789472
MEASINLLSSSSSFPPRTHFRNTTLSTASSVPILNEQTSALPAIPATSLWKQFPTSVLSHDKQDEFKPSSTLRDNKSYQSTLERQMIEEVEFLQEHMGSSLNHLWDLEDQLYPLSGLSYILPSLGNEELPTASAANSPLNVESCDAISLAKQALSASKLALSLAESSELLDGDFDKSLALRLPDNVKVKQTVRSSRLLERKTKRRKPSRPRTIHETDFPVKAEPGKSGQGYDATDPLRLFLWGPETKQLLTIEAEKKLITEIQDFDKLLAVKEQLQSQFEREPTFGEWANAVALSSGTLRSKLHSWKRSREKLINANFRMVVYIAKQYQGRGLSLQDLLQEGSMGLMKSVEKFKPQAGCRFPSYAFWWIRQSIKKAIFQHSRTIRLPESMYSLFGKVLEAKKVCIQEGQKDPTKEELAKRVGITVEKLQNLQSMMRYPLSMQQPVWADQDTTFQEVTADTKIENPGISVERQLMRKHVRNLLGILSPKEQKIVKLRYGIGSSSEKRYSLSEIGVMFGLSKERVRQLESRALNKLKDSLSSHGLKSYTELLM